MEEIVVRGVALDRNQAKVTLLGVPDKPGIAARIFRALADAAISVDMIVQNGIGAGNGPLTDVSFTVDKPDLGKTRRLIEGLKGDIGFEEVTSDENIAKLSLVGVGMRSHAGVAATMFEALAAQGINIEMISTSEIKISLLIELAKGEDAARAIHSAFLG